MEVVLEACQPMGIEASLQVLSAESIEQDQDKRRLELIHYNKLDKGGHFAAWEQPQLFSEEVRAGFRPLRSMS